MKIYFILQDSLTNLIHESYNQVVKTLNYGNLWFILQDSQAKVALSVAWLTCWRSTGQKVSHQRWVWGIVCTQENVKARNPPGSEIQGRHHQRSKSGVSVAQQKGHVSSKIKKLQFILHDSYFLSWPEVGEVLHPCESRMYYI